MRFMIEEINEVGSDQKQKKYVKIDNRTNNSNYYDDNKINDIRNYNKIMITIIMMMMM